MIMTSIPQMLGFNMNLAIVDDNMELGTSPLRQADDIDLEDLDPMNDRSVDNSMFDETEFPQHDVDIMQADTEHLHEDDEMVDDEHDNQNHDSVEPDIGMNENELVDDDEILYEEEIDIPAMEAEIFQNNDITTTTANITMDSNAGVDSVNTHEEQRESTHQSKAVEPTDEIGDLAPNAVEQANQQADQANHKDENPLHAAKSIDQHELNDHSKLPHTTHVIDFAENKETTEDLNEADSQPRNNEHQYTEHVGNSEPSSEGAVELKHSRNTLPTDEKNQLELEQAQMDFNQLHPALADAQTLDNTTSSHPPIRVMYLGEEMSLFATSEEDATITFFLQDVNLANTALDRLLSSCREVLGDTLGHEDELVLDIPSLGLHICEDSKYATSLTLAQILEVYTKLRSNETLESTEPLYCSLSSRVRLSTQFDYLYNAADEGRGFSEIAADYIDTPEDSGAQYELTEDETNDVQPEHHEPRSVDESPTLSSQKYDVEKAEIEVLTGEFFEDTGSDHPEQSNSNPADYIAESEEMPAPSEAEKAKLANEAEKDRQDQEDILNDIDNDFETEDEPREVDLETELDSANPNFPGGQPVFTQTHEHNETKSVEDTASSHTIIELTDTNIDGDEGEVITKTADALENPEQLAVDDELSIPAGDEHLGPIRDADFEPHGIEADELSAHPTVRQELIEQGAGDSFDDNAEDFELDYIESPSTKSNPDHQSNEDTLNGSAVINDDTTHVTTTPVKQMNSKRKAIEEEDDDDLDFLDVSTPEPKRTRSS